MFMRLVWKMSCTFDPLICSPAERGKQICAGLFQKRLEQQVGSHPERDRKSPQRLPLGWQTGQV